MPFGTFHKWFVGRSNMDERSLLKMERLYQASSIKSINCSTPVSLGLLEFSIPFGKSIQGLHWIVTVHSPLWLLIPALHQVFNQPWHSESPGLTLESCKNCYWFVN